MATCENCNGVGETSCPMEYGGMPHPENCPACGGDGRVTCSMCDGTGESEDSDEDE